MQHCADARLLCRVLDHRKRRHLHDVAVGMIEGGPYRLQGAMEQQVAHVGVDVLFGLSELIAQLTIFLGQSSPNG